MSCVIVKIFFLKNSMAYHEAKYKQYEAEICIIAFLSKGFRRLL
jgi:hypothetical protein